MKVVDIRISKRFDSKGHTEYNWLLKIGIINLRFDMTEQDVLHLMGAVFGDAGGGLTVELFGINIDPMRVTALDKSGGYIRIPDTALNIREVQ